MKRLFTNACFSIVVLSTVLGISARCASTPVRQVQASLADAIGDLSDAVTGFIDASHAAAVAAKTPSALSVDLAIQQGAKAYGLDAAKALAAVRTAPSKALALVLAAPILATAERLVATDVSALGPTVDAKLATVKAKLAALPLQ